MKINFKVLLLAVFIALSAGCNSDSREDSPEKENKKGKKKKKKDSEEYVINEWLMPYDLLEISGMTFINDTLLGCIQDNYGILFIYDLKNSELISKTGFAGEGDFEGITLVGKTAYALRSDGVICEINNIYEEEPEVEIITTSLNQGHDTEGLAYDRKNKRLLITCKGYDDKYKNQKPIFAFDLVKKELVETPVYIIDLNNKLLEEKDVAQEDFFRPSDISIHPKTQKLYITDSANRKLVILTKEGAIESVYKLSKQVWPQPEGIAFNSKGELFVSSEGVNSEGKIIKLDPELLKEK